MDSVLSLIATLVNTVANFGAGYLSLGILYAPEVPAELYDKE